MLDNSDPGSAVLCQTCPLRQPTRALHASRTRVNRVVSFQSSIQNEATIQRSPDNKADPCVRSDVPKYLARRQTDTGRCPAEAETVDGAKANIARSHTVTKTLCR
jgi:hypothetical protein